MSRSNPLHSPTAEAARDDSLTDESAGRASVRPVRRTVAIRFAALMRWLHIYLSMFGLAAVLFFSVTGITLNHPDWFYGDTERSTQFQGQIRREWVEGTALSTPRQTEDEEDGSIEQVNKLEVVEFLRKTHGTRGALTEFRVDPSECTVTFKGPGYSADAFIDRESGQYHMTETAHGLVAIVNDLHKGRDTGPVWSVLIDVSAALMTAISLTGLVLLFYLKRRRMPGLIVSVFGTLTILVILLLFVP